MPDVQEVFRMATQKVRPDPGALDRQLEGQRSRTIRRKVGAYALVAAMAAVAAAVAIASLPGDRSKDGTGGEPTVAPTTIPDTDFTIDLQTGAMTPLPRAILDEANEIGGFAVSPQGDTIAFNGTAGDGTTQVFLADVDGTNVRAVTHRPDGASFPTWSPDGGRIAFAAPDSGDQNVFVLDLGTGRSTQVTFEDAGFLGTFQLTPDGSSLIYTFVRSEVDGGRVRIVPLAGGKSTVLVDPKEGDSGDGVLSPDGRFLSFAGDEVVGGPANRQLADADGSQPRILAEGNFPSATWSPDSTRLASWSFPEHEVFVIDIASGESTMVTEGAWPVWLDDHTLIVEPDSGL